MDYRHRSTVRNRPPHRLGGGRSVQPRPTSPVPRLNNRTRTLSKTCTVNQSGQNPTEPHQSRHRSSKDQPLPSRRPGCERGLPGSCCPRPGRNHSNAVVFQPPKNPAAGPPTWLRTRTLGITQSAARKGTETNASWNSPARGKSSSNRRRPLSLGCQPGCEREPPESRSPQPGGRQT